MNHKKLPLQIFLIVACLFFTTDVRAKELVYPRFVEDLITRYLFTRDTIPTLKTLNFIETLLKEADYSPISIEIIITELYERYKNIKTRYIGLEPDMRDKLFQIHTPKHESQFTNKLIEQFKKPKVLTEATLFNALILKKTMELFLDIKKMQQSKPIYSNLRNLQKRLKKTFNKISGKLSLESDLMQSIAFQFNTLAISTDFFREDSWKFSEIEEDFNSFIDQLNTSEKDEFQKLLRLELWKFFPQGVAFSEILLNQDTSPQQIISLYHILQNTYFKNAEITVKSNQSPIQKENEFIQIQFIEAVINKTIELKKEQGVYKEGDEYSKEPVYCQAVNNLLSPLCQNQN